VAFVSSADNLVPEDTNDVWDIFVHDLLTSETYRVSVASDGTEANGTSEYISISYDGRFVSFGSWANNLVPDDTNLAWDVFVHHRGVNGELIKNKGEHISINVKYILEDIDHNNIESGLIITRW
jgi:hypothetical protein